MKTTSLTNRVRRVEGKRRARRSLVILFDLPVGMNRCDPSTRDLLNQIARREIPEIEFSLATSISLMPNVLAMDDDCETSVTAPRVADWFSSELSHEEWLELMEREKTEQ